MIGIHGLTPKMKRAIAKWEKKLIINGYSLDNGQTWVEVNVQPIDLCFYFEIPEGDVVTGSIKNREVWASSINGKVTDIRIFFPKENLKSIHPKFRPY